MPHDDLFEVEELERAAERRLRRWTWTDGRRPAVPRRGRGKVLLRVRRMRDLPPFREDIRDLQLAGRTGRDRRLHGHGDDVPCQDRRRSFAENGEAYRRGPLIDLAKQTFGAGRSAPCHCEVRTGPFGRSPTG